MSMSEWKQTKLFSPDASRFLLELSSGTSSYVREGSRWLDNLADLAGPLRAIVEALNLASPSIGILNAAAAAIQALINDFLESGAYLIIHHNFQSVLDYFGIANVHGDAEAVSNLDPVPTGLGPDASWGDQWLTVDELDFFEGTHFQDVQGFEEWVRDILNAFHDPLDPRRPRIDADGQIGGFLFLTGAPDLLSFAPLIESVATLFELREIRLLWEGLKRLESIDLTDLARLRSAGMFSFVQDSAFQGRGQAPDFMSFKVGDLIPQIGSVLVSFDALADILQASDTVGNVVQALLTIIEHKLRRLSEAVEKVAGLTDWLGRFSQAASTWSVLPLEVESGGVSNLATRIQQSINRPPFGAGSLLFGGGVFVTRPEIYDLLESLFEFTEDPRAHTTLNLTPFDRLAGMDVSEAVIPSEDWAAWSGTELSMSRIARGVYNRQGFLNSTSRGVALTPTEGLSPGLLGGLGGGEDEAGAGGGRPGIAPGGRGDTLNPSSGGSGRPGVSRPGSEEGESIGGIGSTVGGMTLQRASWGAHKIEVTDVRMGTEEGRAVISETGRRTYFVNHAAHDVPRSEPFALSGSGVLPTGLLLEGAVNNQFWDSDRLSQTTLGSSLISRELVLNGAPTTDLSRFRDDAGPVAKLTAEQEIVSWLYTGLTGSVDHSGCAISNVNQSDGSPLILDSSFIGKRVYGRQRTNILAVERWTPFITKIIDVDPATRTIFIAPSVFTEPLALNMMIETFSITELDSGPYYTYVEQLIDSFDTGLGTFSVFARAENAYSSWNTVCLGLTGDLLGPGYFVEQSLELPLLRTLIEPSNGFQIEDGVLIADPGSPEIPEGSLVELYTTSDQITVFYVAEVEEDATSVRITLETAAGDPLEFLDHTIDSVLIRDVSGTYQGFLRASLELPVRHTSRCAIVPPLTDTPMLTLAHQQVQDIEAGVVELDETVTSLTYDAALGGVSYRLELGVGLEGRAAIRLSASAHALYVGRLIQVDYRMDFRSGYARIYPNKFQYPGVIYAWRAQWEQGPLSSPVPTAPSSSRRREPDKLFAEGGVFRIPVDAEAQVTAVYSPTNRQPDVLIDGLRRILFYGTSHFVVSLVGNATDCSLRVSVGSVDFDSTGFTFAAEDQIELVVGVTYGLADVKYKVTINDSVEIDETKNFAVSVPYIDDLVTPGARIYVGSDPNGGHSCLGRIINLKVEDEIT
jgi:hypothetical protein